MMKSQSEEKEFNRYRQTIRILKNANEIKLIRTSAAFSQKIFQMK